MTRALRVGLVREGPRPARLRAHRLRRLGARPRGRPRRRSRRRRPSSCRRGRALQRRRPPLRAARVPRGAVVPPRRRRGRPAAIDGALRRDGGRCSRRALRGPRRARVGAHGRPALRRPELGDRGRAARRARSTAQRSPRCAARFEDEHERALRRSRTRPARRSRCARCGSRRSARPAAAALVRRRRPARRGARARRRRAWLGGDGEDVPVRSRASIGPEPEPGPLLVDEYDTTVVVPPGWSVRRDSRETGTLVLEREPTVAELRRRPRVDPVTLQIVGNALASIADEMATTIIRTAHSTVVRDGMDFSAGALRRGGRDGRAGGQRPVPPRLDPAPRWSRCSSTTATGSARATSSS